MLTVRERVPVLDQPNPDRNIASVMRLSAFLLSLSTTLFAVATAALFVSSPAPAQRMIDSVEVLVNDEPITTLDIEQRLRLVFAISGGVTTEAEFIKVREQVVQAMIDERLQLQEAKEFDFILGEEELEDIFSRRAQSSGQAPDQFAQTLAAIGSSKSTMVKQMEAEYVWGQLVQGRLGPQVNVSDDEVGNYINRIKSNRGKAEFRLSEVVLLINNPGQATSVQANAEQLVARLREGAQFSQIAQQLSASPSAAKGGELGWVTEDTLSEAQLSALRAIEVSEISDPIRTAGGYQILLKQDQRRILTAEPLDDIVDLRNLAFIATSDEALQTYVDGIAQLQQETLDCDNFDQYAARVGARPQTVIGAIPIRNLQPAARGIVEATPVGNLTDPILVDRTYYSFHICGRTEAVVQEPDYDQVLDQLEQQRLAMMGRRFLRDLRRKAIVDYR